MSGMHSLHPVKFPLSHCYPDYFIILPQTVALWLVAKYYNEVKIPDEFVIMYVFEHVVFINLNQEFFDGLLTAAKDVRV